MFLRALASFLLLPGLFAFLLPPLLARLDPWRGVTTLAGVPVMLIGTLLLLWCVRDFYIAGKGTLAPWDPPQRLVVIGLYRYLRNPMYVGVLLLVVGWGVLFASPLLLVYALTLALAFHVRVVVAEEPWLASRFGDDWTRYRGSVRRWLPRITPWGSGEPQ